MRTMNARARVLSPRYWKRRLEQYQAGVPYNEWYHLGMDQSLGMSVIRQTLEAHTSGFPFLTALSNEEGAALTRCDEFTEKEFRRRRLRRRPRFPFEENACGTPH